MCNIELSGRGKGRTCYLPAGHKGRHMSAEARAKRLQSDRDSHAAHPERYREYEKRRQRSPEERKRLDIMWRYGMLLSDWKAMRKAQNYRCAICRKKENLHIDHDHDTKKVRGLLCNNCNNGLGRFKDDPARLRAAADYLEES